MRGPERLTSIWKGPSGRSIPGFVVVLLGLDLALGLIYLAYYLLGRPFEPLANFIDLDGEANLPTWYSSIQWFCVAAVLWVFAERHFVRAQIRSWLLLLLPAIYLAFSLDEVATIHEWLGLLSDALLPNGTREGTLLSSTGLFFLVIGLPFGILFAGLVVALRPHLARSRRAFVLLVTGMVLFLTAAVGVDALSNFVTEGSFLGTLQVEIEELTEMIAATIVLWGGYELIRNSA